MDTRKIVPWLRWPAQVAGMLLVLLFAVMLVGESLASKGPIMLSVLTLAETWGIASIFISITGVILAW